MRLIRFGQYLLLWGIFLVIILGASFLAIGLPAEAGNTPDPTSLIQMEKRYHCGPFFHGHTVKGYLIGKGTYQVVDADKVSQFTLLLWIKRNVFFESCQKN